MELPVKYLQLRQSNFDNLIGSKEDHIFVMFMTAMSMFLPLFLNERLQKVAVQAVPSGGRPISKCHCKLPLLGIHDLLLC